MASVPLGLSIQQVYAEAVTLVLRRESLALLHFFDELLVRDDAEAVAQMLREESLVLLPDFHELRMRKVNAEAVAQVLRRESFVLLHCLQFAAWAFDPTSLCRGRSSGAAPREPRSAPFLR